MLKGCASYDQKSYWRHSKKILYFLLKKASKYANNSKFMTVCNTSMKGWAAFRSLYKSQWKELMKFWLTEWILMTFNWNLTSKFMISLQKLLTFAKNKNQIRLGELCLMQLSLSSESIRMILNLLTNWRYSMAWMHTLSTKWCVLVQSSIASGSFKPNSSLWIWVGAWELLSSKPSPTSPMRKAFYSVRIP